MAELRNSVFQSVCVGSSWKLERALVQITQYSLLVLRGTRVRCGGACRARSDDHQNIGKMPWKSFNLADVLITRFRVEQVEGGIIVAGRPFHSSPCPILILVFSACFLALGMILTVLAYRPVPSNLNIYLRHLSGSHIAGPLLLVIGLIFLAVGLALHIVAQRLKPNQTDQVTQRRQRDCQIRFLPWLRKYSTQIKSKPQWMSKSGRRIFKRNQVIQDLLHHSVSTTEFIQRNDSISDFDCQGDIASFPLSCVAKPTCLPV